MILCSPPTYFVRCNFLARGRRRASEDHGSALIPRFIKVNECRRSLSDRKGARNSALLCCRSCCERLFWGTAASSGECVWAARAHSLRAANSGRGIHAVPRPHFIRSAAVTINGSVTISTAQLNLPPYRDQQAANSQDPRGGGSDPALSAHPGCIALGSDR